jgi:hypothetical protein
VKSYVGFGQSPLYVSLIRPYPHTGASFFKQIPGDVADLFLPKFGSIVLLFFLPGTNKDFLKSFLKP